MAYLFKKIRRPLSPDCFMVKRKKLVYTSAALMVVLACILCILGLEIAANIIALIYEMFIVIGLVVSPVMGN